MDFEKVIERLFVTEGGYVNDKTDRGGETKYGISKAAYPNLDIANLTPDMAKAIYRRDYWDRGHAENIPEDLRGIYFDICVNSGIGNAVKILQRACNSIPGTEIKEDGVLGAFTLAAAGKVAPDRYRMARLAFFADIVVRDPKQAKFWNGWKRRAFEV